MRGFVLIVWKLVYPVVVVLGAPFWLLKMWKRGGWGSGLSERVGFYGRDEEFERQGGVYVHAVSVGEVMLALKLIDRWRSETDDHFVLAVTTATGKAVADDKGGERVRVIYAPLDFGFLIRRVLKRFEPRVVLMVESELWPHLIYETKRLGISLGLVNARLSERSGRRLRRFRKLVSPFLELIDRVAVPEISEVERWEEVGVRAEALVVTGNLKFDPEGAMKPNRRDEFERMLRGFGDDRVAMAVSTFAGEEKFLDEVFRATGYRSVIVPRHAERRDQVVAEIENEVILRSAYQEPKGGETFVIDSTGELRDWTAHADVVVIGKSFFAKGGQNPAEAILAGVPVICGPEMGNFEPLVSELLSAGGIRMVRTTEELLEALEDDLSGQIEAAGDVLAKHDGAVFQCVQIWGR